MMRSDCGERRPNGLSTAQKLGWGESVSCVCFGGAELNFVYSSTFGATFSIALFFGWNVFVIVMYENACVEGVVFGWAMQRLSLSTAGKMGWWAPCCVQHSHFGITSFLHEVL